MVTVVGPGGVGKTRVALEVAGRSDAATVLLLAPVTDPAALPHALAEALGLDVVRGDVLAACVAVLGDRAALLVIDNCEHLREAVRATVEVILTACPQLSVLATSREPVGAAVEYAYRLPPLALPEAEPDPSGVPSVAVFLDRARRVRPGLAPDLRVVADIVRRLDGLPLAIELAAGRLSTFSLTDLATRLDRALDLLGDRAGAEARHRTLRATVEWSYDLLGRDEQRLFRYLAVFPTASTSTPPSGSPPTSAWPTTRAPRCRGWWTLRWSTRTSPQAPATACWRRSARSASTGLAPRARTTPRPGT
jgi:predicted ATPase